jgi:hypothetical protein
MGQTNMLWAKNLKIWTWKAPHLSMKEGSLFCCYQIHWIGMLQIVFLVSLESSWWEGVHGLVPRCLDLQCNFFWNIEWVLHSWISRRNWDVPLVLLRRFWWAGFNGIYLVRFGFRMCEILILKWFLLLKIQINSKKPGFGRKTQLRTW